VSPTSPVALSGPVELTLHKRPVRTVFDLLGDKEDDITYSVGWGLVQSEAFTTGVLCRAFHGDPGEVTAIRLQETIPGAGRTDIEIETDRVHLVVEAKRGWVLPGQPQLSQYARRLAKQHTHDHREMRIAVVSECSQEFVAAKGYPDVIDGVPVVYAAWSDIADLAADTATAARKQAEKRLLRELERYLRGLMTMQNVTSNEVYVVSLGVAELEDSGLSFADIVVDRDRYFHPYGVGGGWPKTPPNYLGFRYMGQLQQIRHVEDYDIVANPARDGVEGLPELQDWTETPLIVYKLGPVIKPPHTVKTGKLFRNARVWAALDLLLTSETIAQARDATKLRLEAAGLV
jgi:hypothetical protein